MSGGEPTLEVAERVVEILKEHQIDAVVIGAMALAVHNYPRDTEDFDLGIAVKPDRLSALADSLRRQGWTVDLHLPDGSDPLGGVIDVRAPDAELVQVVNFENWAGGFPAAVRDAATRAVELSPGSPLRAADLFSLIALKLYAGGPKSKLDVLELLDRNKPVDLDVLRDRCRKYGLEAQLDAVLALADG